MRFMGIDYGTKRVGLALSDDKGMMAFPHVVLTNDASLLKEIEKIVWLLHYLLQNICWPCAASSHSLAPSLPLPTPSLSLGLPQK